MNIKQRNPIVCKECGWDIPDELFAKLLDEEPIYCEMCGYEIYRKDYNIQHIFQKKPQQKSIKLWDVLSTAKKKSIEYKKKLKSKLKNLKENL